MMRLTQATLRATQQAQRGLSLIELMVAMTLGLMILSGLAVVFATSSQSQRELQRSAQQIENGRYAMDVLTHELHHAGFYGRYAAYATGTALPDPCVTGDETALLAALAYPVQGFVAADAASRPSLTGTSCTTYLPSANLHPGSDIIVIRRTATTPLRHPTDGLTPAVGSADTAVSNEVYLQSNPESAEIQFGNGAAITATSNASGGTANIKQKNGNGESIRKFNVLIYFVAPCSIPASGTICTGANDDSGKPTPTLKRLELTVSGGSRTFNVAPIAEGIDVLKIEYGIDNSPSTANASTTRIGDGAPDLYMPNASSNAPSAADFPNAVSAKVWLVARSPEASAGYTDTKSYPVATSASALGAGTVAGSGLTYGPYKDAFKRHAFFSEIRMTNLSARRENP